LLVVVHASDPLGFGSRAGQGGEQQAGEDGNDGDNDQEFNNREATPDAFDESNLCLFVGHTDRT
jgi:hypothetical protein